MKQLSVVIVEFDDLNAEQVNLVNAHPLAVGCVQPVKPYRLWRCQFRVEPPLCEEDIASDVRWWAAASGIPFRKIADHTGWRAH